LSGSACRRLCAAGREAFMERLRRRIRDEQELNGVRDRCLSHEFYGETCCTCTFGIIHVWKMAEWS
jgi:hypothetical protein